MKTYCISDLHGHYDKLMNFVETLNENDKVFVLGDAVDKGPEAIKCLQYVMSDNRFEMLLGNHEYMMYCLLSAEPHSYEYHKAYDLWVNWNEGRETLNQYNKLDPFIKESIYGYIKNLPLCIPNVKVNDKSFYLVHSCPNGNKQIKMSDLAYDDDKIATYIWDRVNPQDKLKIDDQVVIAGHTVVHFHLGIKVEEVRPVYDTQDIKDAHYIDIDGGLATGLDNSRLIALCLDDLSYKLY